MYVDVFNGDADGICALIQLRLHQPLDAVLVTGIKRDIQLLDKVSVNPGDHLTVLDISLEKNSTRVKQFLEEGASIFYVDHHQSGVIPEHPHLTTVINTDKNVCTSLLVNQYLNSKYPLWAITAAFGDNLKQSAEQLAGSLSLRSAELATLANLGVYLNYNSYGESLDDLHVTPDKLYREMAGYPSPFDFITGHPTLFAQLEHGYQQDMANAQRIRPEYQSHAVAVYRLPDTIWARRVSGVFSNYLANQQPDRAHAIITSLKSNDYQVSVRAPLNHQTGADELCSAFATGGGRKAAAGINHLPIDQLSHFIQAFERFYAQS